MPPEDNWFLDLGIDDLIPIQLFILFILSAAVLCCSHEFNNKT